MKNATPISSTRLDPMIPAEVATAAAVPLPDVQPVPDRIYAEARAVKARRRERHTVSVVQDGGPIGLELAEEQDA